MMRTLINENNLLSERIEASLNYERIERVSVPDLKRANKYLLVAQEAIRRYANRIQMIEDYDQAEADCKPWVLINSKEEIYCMAMRNLSTYKNCYAYYKQILLKEISK